MIWSESHSRFGPILGIVIIIMSSLEELKDAVRDTLAARGSLGQIQARVRAEIFSALEETVFFLHSFFGSLHCFVCAPSLPSARSQPCTRGGLLLASAALLNFPLWC